MTAELRILLFGGLQLLLDGIPVTGLISNKAPALMAYLALAPRAHQRDALAALFWGELPDVDAKNNLRQVLTSLRKVLDPYLDVTRETVALRAGVAWRVDALEFTAALRAARGQDLAELHRAVDLYRGDFMAGILLRDAPDFEEWLLAERTRYRELALHALHTATALHLDGAEYDEAIDCATRLLALDSWREEAYVQLMLALANTGQRTAALGQYQNCRRMLHEVFGVEPSTETTTLYERIRAAANRPRYTLPVSVTEFVGRTAEVAQLRRRLAMRNCRLVSIIGPGGAGKTRLAIQVASVCDAMFLNGACYVPLATVGRGDPEALLARVAEALGITLAPGNHRRQLYDHLRHHEILLVLDNAEHLVADLGWLGELLAAAPALKVLVTTRERLDLQAEHLFQLGGMQLAAPAAAAEHCEAAAFFARCAERSHAGAGLSAASMPAVVRICELVGGLPLGIELAAAMVHAWSCQAIADAISANLDFLVTTRRDTDTRQRSLRAVFDHSWRLLAADEQRAFAMLAVFRGGFTREAARALGIATHTLASVVDKSLVRRIDDDRYDLHEILRQYAAERFAADAPQAEAAQAQHAAYYAEYLTRRAAHLGGSHQAQALAEIGGEIDNIRDTWNWLTEHGQFHTLAALAAPLFHFYEIRSWTQEGAERFGQATDAVRAAALPGAERHALLAALLPRQARFLARDSRRSEAQILLDEALALPEADIRPADRALALNYRGLVAQYAGDYDAAVNYFRQSAVLCERTEDRSGLARAMNNHAVVVYFSGDYATAEPLLHQSLAIRRTLGDAKGVADGLNNLAILLHELKRYPEETALLQEALATYRQLDDLRGIATCLHNLGGVHLAQGEFAAAQRAFQASFTQHEKYGDRNGMAGALSNLATVALRRNELEEARSCLLPALRMAQEASNVPMTLDLLVGVAEWMIDRGKSTQALPILHLCLHHAQDGDTRAEAARLIALAGKVLPAFPASPGDDLDRVVELALASLTHP